MIQALETGHQVVQRQRQAAADAVEAAGHTAGEADSDSGTNTSQQQGRADAVAEDDLQ